MSLYKETTGYLIHQRNFKDSSLIIEFFSKDQGMIHLVAKGIKKNNKQKILLQTFCLLKIQYFGKSQLKTISSIDLLEATRLDGIIEKTAGLYVNELIHLSLAENEVATAVYDSYLKVINKLGKSKLTPLLRFFEKKILKHNGFELNIDSFEEPQDWLTVDNNLGIIKTSNQFLKLCQVNDLRKFINDEKLDLLTQKRINLMMMRMIDLSVSYRRVYARELLIELTKKQ